MRYKWEFENGGIKAEQLVAIVEDFEKVRQHSNHDVRNGEFIDVKGIEKHPNDLWACFQDTSHSTSFLFGRWNTTMGFDVRIDNDGYNELCTAFLAIAKKHLGHDIHVESSESDAAWRKGISLCQCILGHEYDLIDITENGKLRYKTWELAGHGKTVG